LFLFSSLQNLSRHGIGFAAVCCDQQVYSVENYPGIVQTWTRSILLMRGCEVISKKFTRIMLGLGVLAITSLAGSNALADGIILIGPDHDNKIVPPLEVLSLQHHGNHSFEAGGVSFNGSRDVSFGDTSAGPHNLTIPFTRLGTSPRFLGILFNVNENNGNCNSGLFINSLVLTAYDGNGHSTLIGSIENLLLIQIRPAQGSASDYQFGLDSAAAARLEAAFILAPNLRLGLYGNLSNVGGGPERFTFNVVAPNVVAAVPEATTMLLLGTCLLGLAARLRRRRPKVSRSEGD